MPEGAPANHLLRRADVVCGHAGEPGAAGERGIGAAAVRIGGRGAAPRKREAVGGTLWGGGPGRDKADPEAAHLSLPSGGGKALPPPPPTPCPPFPPPALRAKH